VRPHVAASKASCSTSNAREQHVAILCLFWRSFTCPVPDVNQSARIVLTVNDANSHCQLAQLMTEMGGPNLVIQTPLTRAWRAGAPATNSTPNRTETTASSPNRTTGPTSLRTEIVRTYSTPSTRGAQVTQHSVKHVENQYPIGLLHKHRQDPTGRARFSHSRRFFCALTRTDARHAYRGGETPENISLIRG